MGMGMLDKLPIFGPRSLLLCLLLFSWFPSCHRPVSSCLCGHLTPQNPRSAKSPWRTGFLTLPDSC